MVLVIAQMQWIVNWGTGSPTKAAPGQHGFTFFSELKTQLTFNEEAILGNLVFLAALSQIKGDGGGEEVMKSRCRHTAA